MPYYHVRITKRSRRTDDRLELDLTEDELMERIVNPFLEGKSFLCGGEPIDPFDVEVIHINETEKPSSELIPEIRAKRARSSFLVAISDRWYVTKKGRDVTRKFIIAPPKKREEKPTEVSTNQSKNVFIVHGRDNKPALELARIIEKDLGLKPIILHEKPDKGRTVIEKLEDESLEVGYAFVILTPDDVGNLIERFNEGKLTYRARQNVVLEFGYFMGLLGRDKVCCLHMGDIELPSDMQGIIYKLFKDSVKECFHDIVKGLKAAGYEIKI